MGYARRIARPIAHQEFQDMLTLYVVEKEEQERERALADLQRGL